MFPTPASTQPLPGVGYHGTMQTSDIYPAVLGIGGIRSSDYSIPAVGEAVVTRSSEAMGTANLPAGLFSTPAGWVTLGLVAIIALVIHHGGRG